MSAVVILCYFVCVHFHAVSGYPAFLAVYPSARYMRQSALQYQTDAHCFLPVFPTPITLHQSLVSLHECP